MDLFVRGIIASAAIGPGPSQTQGPIRRLEEHAIETLASGALIPVIGQSFPLAKAADAHRAIESRGTVGKTVLTTGGPL